MNCSNINAQSKERERNTAMFSGGIGESPLPTSPRWSTCARIKFSLRADSSTLHHCEWPITAHNLSWVIHKLRRMITKLPITTNR